MKYNPLDEISSPTGVKGIWKYLQRNDESTTVFSETKKGCPVHVKAAIAHNDLVRHFKQDNKYGFINNGDKIRWVYLKNNPLGLNMEEQRRDAIRAVFYVNQLMMQQGPQMTATEVIQRNEEKMRLLGPVLGRLQSELLKPLIDRVFAILLRNDMLPPAPEFLSGRDIEIEYVSPLAKAQKSSELQSIMRAIEILGSLANVAPVFDYVNFDNLVKHLADIVGMPQKLLKSQNQVNAEREQAAAQAAEQQQMAQMQQVAQAGGDIAPLAKALPEEARAVANAEVE